MNGFASNDAGFDGPGFDGAGLRRVLSELSVAQLLAVHDEAEKWLATASLSGALSGHAESELLDVLELREQTRRRGEVFDAALYLEVSDRDVDSTAGFMSVHSLYARGVRLGDGEARRRKVTATGIARFTAMTGEKLEPALPDTAAAVAEGEIGAEHVSVIAEAMERLPSRIAPDDRAQAETMLAAAARELDPGALVAVGNRILAWLDPDGTLADDRERRRQRGFHLQPQNRQMMSKVRALLTPTLRAKLEVVLHQWAAAGMNNPDDPESPRGAADQPGLDPAVLAAAAARDDRTIGQRQHDALEALCEWALALAGQPAPDRIPSQVVVTVTDEDLARQAGIAWTATGARLPISDLVKLAADAVPHLAVFSAATGQCLYLGRARRFASLAQRLALFARDRGCTGPGCSVPFVRTEAHHMPDWSRGGLTDIDHLGGACGRHNRSSGDRWGQWESVILDRGARAGRVAWRSAGRGGAWQVNPVFHPEQFAPHRARASTDDDHADPADHHGHEGHSGAPHHPAA